MDQETLDKVLAGLAKAYPDSRCELKFTNPFELLIATILSAQSTDKKVNQVTERLFAKCKTPADFIALGESGVAEEIKEIGLYRNKAKNIVATCCELMEKYDGQVPRTLNELMALPGVGRKTANVVLANAFGVPTMAVDTHVFRVANRIGLAQSDKVDTVEKQLMDIIPKDLWIAAHHWLIFHGRRICTARKPNCPQCPVSEFCRAYLNHLI